MRASLIALAAGSLWASAASSQSRIPSTEPVVRMTDGAASATAPTEVQPSTTVSGVVVEAQTKDALKAFATAVDKYVHENGRPGRVQQLSRWTRPVCPETFGLRKDYDAFISQRIAAVAKDVGATGAGKCRGTNVLVVFTVNPQAVMADVRDHHSILLGPHYINETAGLAAFQPPMKSWYVTLTAVPVYNTANKDGAEAPVLDSAYGQEQPHCTGLRDCTLDYMRTMKSEFAFSLVVVESGRIVGKPIGAIADEIAMRVLSRPAERVGCSALPSIADLLDPACPGSGSLRGLSAYDKAYLKALYAPHDTEILAYERQRIKGAVEAVGLAPGPASDAPLAAADGEESGGP